ncbi:MAG: thioesterase family protein [Bacteroidales bacterium]|nr:thioesterase family protein [Bacteroidales bacterium]
MIVHKSSILVAYADTDQMGFVHHSNYAKYYESARWNAFHKLGLPYKLIENSGILMPVTNLQMQFIKPAFFDDELLIQTIILKIPTAIMHFDYKMYNQHNQLINKAWVETAFVSKTSGKPCRPPQNLIEILEKSFSIGLQS